jgi:hypothetical protein
LWNLFHPDAQFEFTGLAHKARAVRAQPRLMATSMPSWTSSTTDPRLTWWFDHHQSAFLSPEDGEHFRHDTSGHKFFDPAFRSCTKYIATVAREKFGYDSADLKELVGWADIIDGALYKDAQEAVDLGTPATQLTLTIEGSHGSETVQKIIRMMR